MPTDLIRIAYLADAIIRGEGEPRARLQALCAMLTAEVSHYNWVGFYLVDPKSPRELVLGPYVGEPTEHTRIPFGKGICGQVAESEETFVVPDVSEEDNYLACSLTVKSEIVVPVMLDGRFVGQLDIASHTRDAFGPEDEALLEAIAEGLGELCEAVRKE